MLCRPARLPPLCEHPDCTWQVKWDKGFCCFLRYLQGQILLRVAASDWLVDPGRSGHSGTMGQRVKRRWFASWSDPNVTGKPAGRQRLERHLAVWVTIADFRPGIRFEDRQVPRLSQLCRCLLPDQADNVDFFAGRPAGVRCPNFAMMRTRRFAVPSFRTFGQRPVISVRTSRAARAGNPPVPSGLPCQCGTRW